MRCSRASILRRVAVVLAAGCTTGCSMIRELDLSGPVLPGTLFAILTLLVGMFAVAWLRYAHRDDGSARRAARRSDNVA